ncbi:hypothetical protein NL676_005119 [Syzygium grande]|nr:hypothetical protein NL676_005119 [Syzygium grande]
MIPLLSFCHILFSPISIPPSFPFKPRPAPNHSKLPFSLPCFDRRKKSFFRYFSGGSFGILITSMSLHHCCPSPPVP